MTNDINKKLMALLLELLSNNNSEIKNVAENPEHKYTNQYCIFRTYSSGVFFGKLKEYTGEAFQGSKMIISESRIIHSWSGAKTTLDISANGVTSGNLSGVIDEHEIIGVIDCIPCREKCKKQFLAFPNAEYKF